MKVRHQLWMAKYPNTPEARDFPLTGIENARPETKAAGQPRVDPSKLPFDPREFIKSVPVNNSMTQVIEKKIGQKEEQADEGDCSKNHKRQKDERQQGDPDSYPPDKF